MSENNMFPRPCIVLIYGVETSAQCLGVGTFQTPVFKGVTRAEKYYFVNTGAVSFTIWENDFVKFTDEKNNL